MSKSKQNSNATPSVLAFERNLDISDAFFTQCNSQDKNPVEEAVKIREKSVRGTMSHRLSKISVFPLNSTSILMLSAFMRLRHNQRALAILAA